eukprot:1565374-Pleurochrysis_carterae.AAC.2
MANAAPHSSRRVGAGASAVSNAGRSHNDRRAARLGTPPFSSPSRRAAHLVHFFWPSLDAFLSIRR